MSICGGGEGEGRALVEGMVTSLSRTPGMSNRAIYDAQQAQMKVIQDSA